MIDGTSRWALLCKQCSADLNDALEQFLVGQEEAPWLASAPIEAPDETWWTTAEIRQALAMFLGSDGRRKTGFLSQDELRIFRGIFTGIAGEISSHADPAVAEVLRERILDSRGQ